MSGLRDGLRGTADGLADELSGGRFDGPARIGMRSRIRRGRAIRAARTTSLAAVAVVVVVGVAAWGVAGHPTQPAPISTPTSTPTSTPSPSPSPSPDPTSVPDDTLAAPGTVTADPALPEAKPLPPGMLENPPAGSTLVTYSTDTTGMGDSHRVIWLVTPSGDRYQVLEVYPEVNVAAWQPGSHVAVVIMCCDASVGLLDLLTGEITGGWQEGFSEAYRLLLGANPDGDQVWFAGSPQEYPMMTAVVMGAADGTTRSVPVAPAPVSSAALSPDGKHVVLNEAVMEGFVASSYGPTRVVDLETGAETLVRDANGVGLMCSEVGWRDDGTAICTARSSAAATEVDPAPADSDRLVTIDVSTGATRNVVEWAQLGFQLSDVVAVDGGYAGIGVPYDVVRGGVGTIDRTASELVFLDAGGSLTRFADLGASPVSGDPGARVLGAVDSRILVQAPAGYQGAQLFLLEVRTGLVTELVPAMPGPGGIVNVAIGS